VRNTDVAKSGNKKRTGEKRDKRIDQGIVRKNLGHSKWDR